MDAITHTSDSPRLLPDGRPAGILPSWMTPEQHLQLLSISTPYNCDFPSPHREAGYSFKGNLFTTEGSKIDLSELQSVGYSIIVKTRDGEIGRFTYDAHRRRLELKIVTVTNELISIKSDPLESLTGLHIEVGRDFTRNDFGDLDEGARAVLLLSPIDEVAVISSVFHVNREGVLSSEILNAYNSSR